MNHQRIHVVHVLNELDYGGVTKVVLDVCSDGDHAIYEYTIVCLSERTQMLKDHPLPGHIRVLHFNYRFSESYSMFSFLKYAMVPGKTKEAAKEVIEAIISLKPDILHFHTLPRELMIGKLLQSKINSPMIYTDHVLRFNENELNSLRRNVLAGIFRIFYSGYHVIPVSKSVQKFLTKYRLVSSAKQNRLIENRLKIKSALNIDYSDVKCIVYVARISKTKGHKELIDAWAKVKNRGEIKLYFIGPDESGGQMEKYSQQILGDNSIEFLGARSDVFELLKDADLAVFPSNKEGLPLALIEKMAMGLPIIVSDIDELTDLIENNQNGLVYPLGNTDQLASEISLLIQDRNLREKLGRNARQSYLQRFNGSLATEYEKFYNELTSVNLNKKGQ